MSGRIFQEKIDFMEAFGEALVNLDDGDVKELTSAARRVVEEAESAEAL